MTRWMVLVGALLLTGCAGQAMPVNPAAMAYARISVRISDLCGASPTLDAVICKDLKAADRLVMRSFLTPPAQSGITPGDLAELLGIFAGAAK